jgi:hypothetical protein
LQKSQCKISASLGTSLIAKKNIISILGKQRRRQKEAKFFFLFFQTSLETKGFQETHINILAGHMDKF